LEDKKSLDQFAGHRAVYVSKKDLLGRISKCVGHFPVSWLLFRSKDHSRVQNRVRPKSRLSERDRVVTGPVSILFWPFLIFLVKRFKLFVGRVSWVFDYLLVSHTNPLEHSGVKISGPRRSIYDQFYRRWSGLFFQNWHKVKKKPLPWPLWSGTPENFTSYSLHGK